MSLVTVYNPINLKKYIINFNEIKFWIDLHTLENSLSKNTVLKENFNYLKTFEKERLLSLIENKKEPFKYNIRNWNCISGIDIKVELNVYYNQNESNFFDVLKNNMNMNFFNKKDLYSINSFGSIFINNIPFETKSIFVVSDDFIKEKEMSLDEPIPIYNSYHGVGTNLNEVILLDENGNLATETRKHISYIEGDWVYEFVISISNNCKNEFVYWNDIPKINDLYDFFVKKGYKVEGDSLRRILWMKDGNTIEYSQNPHPKHNPSIIIREAKYKTDVYNRNELGKELFDEMAKSGIFEKINFLKGSKKLNNAILKLNNKNKRNADILLNKSIDDFNECIGDYWTEAKTNIIISLWIKSRIAKRLNDNIVEEKCYKYILKTFKELKLFEDAYWFIKLLEKEKSKEYILKLVPEIFPFTELEKHYFIDKAVYSNFLELFDKSISSEIRPENISKSEWYYNLIFKTYELGLIKLTKKYLLLFFKHSLKNPLQTIWFSFKNENLLNIVIDLKLDKKYYEFTEELATAFKSKRNKLGITNISSIGLKEYRWDAFSLCTAEIKWAYNALYILSKRKKSNKIKIDYYIDQIYDSLNEAFKHLDYSEKYNQTQLNTIALLLINLFNFSQSFNQPQLKDFIEEELSNFSNKYMNLELYQLLHGLFKRSERENISKILIESWIEKEGDIDVILTDPIKLCKLIDIYISVEDFENALKAIAYGLKTINWEFYELSVIYDHFLVAKKYFKGNGLDLVEDSLFQWINIHLKEKQNGIAFRHKMQLKIEKIKNV